MEWDANLYSAALSHVNDIGPLGLTQHDSSDGTTFDVRVKSFFTETETIGENISFGT